MTDELISTLLGFFLHQKLFIKMKLVGRREGGGGLLEIAEYKTERMVRKSFLLQMFYLSFQFKVYCTNVIKTKNKFIINAQFF